MVSAKFVAVLVAAVLVQVAVALPADVQTLEKDKCTAGMAKAIGILKGLSALIEANRGLVNSTEAALGACKQHENPEKEAACEKQVKIETSLRAAKLLKRQVAVASVGKAVLAHLEECRPQKSLLQRDFPVEQQLYSLISEDVLLPKDLSTCFAALDASQEQLTELGELIDASGKLIQNVIEKINECFKPPVDKVCPVDVMLAERDAINAALDKNLKWKEDAQSSLDSISNCLVA